MMRGLFLAAIAAGTLAFAAPCAAGPELRVDAENAGTREITVATHAGQSERITLALGKAAVVQLDTDARDVLVSDPAVVDAVVRTPRRIFLLAQKTGQTNAFFFDGAGHQILTVDIRVERDVTDLMNAIHANFPDSNVRVTALNDNVVLTGSVASAQDSARAQDLAAQFVRDPGKAVDPTKVVNMLKIGGHEQVMLKVRVAEMQRQIAKQFGINMQALGTVGAVPINLHDLEPLRPDRPGACRQLGALTVGNAATKQRPGDFERARAERPHAHAGRTQSHGGVGRDGEVSRRRRIPGSGGTRPAGQHQHHLQAFRRGPVLHAGGA